MKKLFIACALSLVIFSSASAQKKSGAIQFEMTADPSLMAAGSGITLTDEMKARMPKAVKSNFELLFTATNASYMPVQEVEDSNGGGRGGGMAMMMMRFGGGGGNREYFYSFADQKLNEVFDLNDTTYSMASKLTLKTAPSFNANQNSAVQIQPDPPVVEVVKSDETKEIAGFLCHKVTVKSTRKVKILDLDREVTDETVLWYTNDLGFNFSPNPTMWTEGAVLSIEGRGTSTTAKSVEYRKVSSGDVTAPKKATTITDEEYQAKMAAMIKSRSRSGNRQGGQSPIRNIVIN